MLTWFKERFSKGSDVAMIGSPTKSEKAVAALTEDKDQMMGLSFVRMAKNLHNEKDLVKYLLGLRENNVLAEIKKLEEENGHFDGFSELYQMPPSGFRTQWKPNCHSIIYNGHSYLSNRLEALNSIKDSTKAVLVIGSDHASAEEFRTQGYPKSDQFTTAFDSSFVFFPAMELAYWNDCEVYLRHLKDLSGTFDYKNLIVVIVDDQEEVLKNFAEPTKEGKHKVCGHVGSLDDKQYKAEPEKVLAVLEPPDEKELAILDTFVVAYGGKLLRSGYFLGTRGKEPDHNMWTGDGMSRLMDAAYGIERKWRPFLTQKRDDASLPDVSLHSIEDAARALHVVNRLTKVFQENELL